MSKVPTFKMVELRSQLLRCAGSDGCEAISGWVGYALAPAQAYKRTSVTVFGLCRTHLEDRAVLNAALSEQGFRVQVVVLPWDELGDVLDMLQDAGLLRVA